MSTVKNPPAPARIAAAPRVGTATSAIGKEFLTFALGDQEYGLDILNVQEIRNFETPTRINNSPANVTGVVNLRGVIVPIVDLRRMFQLDGAKCAAHPVVIILNVGSRVVGVVVDSVSDVLTLGGEQIKPAPEFSGTGRENFITGLGTVREDGGERILVLLDIEPLIASNDVALGSHSLQ